MQPQDEPQSGTDDNTDKSDQPNSQYDRRSAKSGQSVVGDLSKKPEKPESIKHPSPPSLEQRPKSKMVGRIFKVLVYLSIAAALVFGFWQRQNILDWYKLRSYTPPAEISALATESYMNQYGTKIFYLGNPVVQQKKQFYETCNEGESVVLGCYKPLEGIFLLDVTDKRLDGVEQVTAAHEMLHAAYDRLSFSEKEVVKKQLNQAFNDVKSDEIKAKLKLYSDNGADLDNELHSILGSEVANLPPELETYYQQYFTNRQAVVKLSNKFQAEFTRRKTALNNLDKKLAGIEAQVKSNNQQLKSLEDSIVANRAKLDALLKADKIEEYNAGVAAYNQSLAPYNNLLAQTKSLISQYKVILTQRNQIAAEAQELNRSLDSSITTDAKELQ